MLLSSIFSRWTCKKSGIYVCDFTTTGFSRFQSCKPFPCVCLDKTFEDITHEGHYKCNIPPQTVAATPWETPVETPQRTIAETPNITVPPMTPIREYILMEERKPSNLKFYLIYAAVVLVVVIIAVIIIIYCCHRRHAKTESTESSTVDVPSEEINKIEQQYGTTITIDVSDLPSDDPFASDFDDTQPTLEVSESYFLAMEEK